MMNPVERSEILPLGDYEQVRPHFRRRIIDEKAIRRTNVGEHMSVVFENHDTVLLQIQEMLRTERITREDAIAHEIDTYNELVPGDDELSMTLFVEINDKDLREKTLIACAGMEERVFLRVAGERYPAKLVTRAGTSSERTTAVQYYKVPLPNAVASAWRDGAIQDVAVVVDHPSYQAEAALTDAAIASLTHDLR